MALQDIKFDPNKPFTVTQQFDPSKPFTVSKEPEFDTSLFDEDEELKRLEASLVRAQDPLAQVGFTPSSRPETFQQDILRRKAQLLGFAEGGAPASVRQFESSGLDAEESIRNLLKREFGEDVQVKRIEQLDNQLAFFDPNENQWKLVNPEGLDVGDIASMRGPAIQLGTEALGAVGGFAVGGPPGAMAGGIGGAAIGEYLRLLDGKNAGAHNLTDEEMLIESLKSAGIAAAGGLAGSALARTVQFIKNGKILNAAAELDQVLGDAGLETVQAGRQAALRAEEVTGVPRTVTGQAELGARETGQTTVPEILGGIERQVIGTRGGRELTQQRLTAESQLLGAEERLLAGEVAGPDVSGALTRDITSIEKLASKREGQAVREIGEILDGGQDFQRIVGDEVQGIWQEGRKAIGRRFNEEYGLVANEALREGVTFNLKNLGVTAKAMLKEGNADIFKSLAPDDLKVLKALTDNKNLNGVDYSVFQRGLSDLNAEIRAVNKGLSQRRNIGQLTRLRDEMEQAKEIAFKDHPELREIMRDVDEAYQRLKSGVDGGIIGQVIRKNEFGNIDLASEDVIETVLESSSKTFNLRRVLDDPEMAFLNEGAEAKIREGVHDFYLDSVIKDNVIDPAAHRTFMKDFRNPIRNLLGEDDITKFDNAAGSVKMISTLRKEQGNIIKQLNESLGVNVEKLTPTEMVRKIWNTKDPEKIGNALSILKSSPKELEAFKGAIRNEIRRAGSSNGILKRDKFTNYISDRSDTIEQVFGKKYADSLEDLSNAIVLAKPGAVVRPSEITEKGISVPAAALRVFFAPLTQQGRAFTAGKLALSKSKQKVFADLLSDADRFVSLMGKLKTAKTNTQIATILGQFGLTGVNLPRLEE